jgi:hypothetical protein
MSGNAYMDFLLSDIWDEQDALEQEIEELSERRSEAIESAQEIRETIDRRLTELEEREEVVSILLGVEPPDPVERHRTRSSRPEIPVVDEEDSSREGRVRVVPRPHQRKGVTTEDVLTLARREFGYAPFTNVVLRAQGYSLTSTEMRDLLRYLVQEGRIEFNAAGEYRVVEVGSAKTPGGLLARMRDDVRAFVAPALAEGWLPEPSESNKLARMVRPSRTVSNFTQTGWGDWEDWDTDGFTGQARTLPSTRFVCLLDPKNPDWRGPLAKMMDKAGAPHLPVVYPLVDCVDCQTCKLQYREDHLDTATCGRRPSKHPGVDEQCDLVPSTINEKETDAPTQAY